MTNRSDPFPAHIRRTGETEVRQPVSEHNRQASQYALNAIAAARLGGAEKLVGLLHDMGKYTVRYRGYLENAVCGMGPAVRGSVNHSFAAVRYLLEHYHGRASPCGPLTADGASGCRSSAAGGDPRFRGGYPGGGRQPPHRLQQEERVGRHPAGHGDAGLPMLPPLRRYVHGAPKGSPVGDGSSPGAPSAGARRRT